MLILRPAVRSVIARSQIARKQSPLPHRFQQAGPVGIQHQLPRFLTGQSGPPTPGNDTPNPVDDATENQEEEEREARKEKWKNTAFKMFESAATTGASIFILACVGITYTRYYKWNVLEKMENAFREGDPVLELAANGKEIPIDPSKHEIEKGEDYDRWIPREEQDKINKIISGETKGRYHLLLGEKGTGKSSMLIDAMSKINGEGCSMMEAHADLEVFRVRLGRCLDFEYHEDNIGSLFSIRGPRDAGPILDIERAFNKLEKVALRRRAKKGRPLILIINQAHLIRDDEDGRDLIELIQQRAEQWAASNLATVIINSDKYWVFERLKQYATRMEVHQIKDLTKVSAMQALRNYRMKYWNEKTPNSVLEEVYDKIGGRLTFLNRVAKSEDMLAKCDHICAMERIWFLNNCAILGEEMDDDVMDQQKYAVSLSLLPSALLQPSIPLQIPCSSMLISVTVYGHGPSQCPLSPLQRNGNKIRPQTRPHPTRVPAAPRALHHDAQRLYPAAPRTQHLCYRQPRHGPRRLCSHAESLQ